MSNEILEGIFEAFRLIFTFDTEVWGVILVSFRVSLTSTFLAALVALPIGSYIGLRKFKGKKELTNLINELHLFLNKEMEHYKSEIVINNKNEIEIVINNKNEIEIYDDYREWG